MLCPVLWFALIFPSAFAQVQPAQEQSPPQEKAQEPEKKPEKKKDGEPRVEAVAIEELLPLDVIAFVATSNLSSLVTNFRRLEAVKAFEARLPKAERESKDNPLAEAARFLSFGIKDAGVLDETRLGFALFKASGQPLALPDAEPSAAPPPAAPAPGAKTPPPLKRSPNRPATATVEANASARNADGQPADSEQKPPDPHFIAFVEAPRLALAQKAREQFIAYYSEMFSDLGKPEDAKPVKYRGATVERFKNGFVGVMIGATYVMGDLGAIDNVLTVHGARDAARLSDNLDFVRARTQLSTPAGLFAYLNGKPFSDFIMGLIGSSGPLVADAGLQAAITPEVIKNAALSSTFEREGVVDRLIVTFDPAKKNLLTTLFAGPTGEFHASRYVPATTQIFINQNADLPRLYDELFAPAFFGSLARAEVLSEEQRKVVAVSGGRAGNQSPPLVTVPPGGSAAAFEERIARRQKEMVARYERELGFKFREELAKDFGSEISLAWNLPKPPSARPNDTSDRYAVFFALRDREAARAAVTNLAVYLVGSMGEGMEAAANDRTGNAESDAPRASTDANKEKSDEQIKKDQAQRAMMIAAMPSEVYKKAEILSLLVMSVGFSDDFMVIADSAETIKQLLDTPESGTPITLDANFRRAMSGGSGSPTAQVYLAPNYFDTMLGDFLTSWLAKAPPEDNPAPISAPATLAAFIEGNERSLRLEAFSPIGIPGLIATQVMGSNIQSRADANEVTAQQALRQVALAEKNYAAKHDGHFGTLDEIAKAGVVKFNFETLKREPQTYRYELKLKPDAAGYEATATPAAYGRQSRASFFVDESGKMRKADKNGEPATVKDEMLPQYGDPNREK